jgi:hypothetical protein
VDIDNGLWHFHIELLIESGTERWVTVCTVESPHALGEVMRILAGSSKGGSVVWRVTKWLVQI